MFRQTVRRCFPGTAIVLFLASVASLASVGWTQTIQLPTVRTFGVGTTVSVPDRGAASLGGNTRSIVTPTGSSHTTTQGHVTARIIDLAEMDAAVLAEARRRKGIGREGKRGASMRENSIAVAADASLARARFLSRNVSGTRHNAIVGNANQSLSDRYGQGNKLRQRQGFNADSPIGETTFAELMQRGREAMKAGQYKAAKRYFMAAAAK